LQLWREHDFTYRLRGKAEADKYANLQAWLEESRLAELAGCYCFKNGREYIYIGQGGVLRDRIKQHEKKTYFTYANAVRIIIPRYKRQLNQLERLLIRQVRVDVKVKVTKKFGEYGNVIDTRSEATATAANTSIANLRESDENLDIIEKNTVKIVEVADVIGVDRAEALGIGARETFLGSDIRRGAADFQQPRINPLQLTRDSGLMPTTDRDTNIKRALSHYKRVGLQGYGPGPNNAGGPTYIPDVTGYINQIKAGISGSIRTSSPYRYRNYYIDQQEFRPRLLGQQEFKGKPNNRLP
jgi:hypothetical protein